MALGATDTNIVSMTAAADEITGTYFVNFFYWFSKSAIAGDDLSVTDTAGNVIWNCVADGSNFIKLFPVKTYVTGVKVATIDSGTLYVVKQSFAAGKSV